MTIIQLRLIILLFTLLILPFFLHMLPLNTAIENNEHERVDLGPAVRPGNIDTSVGDPTWPTRRTLLSRAGVSTVRTLWLSAKDSTQGGVSTELLAVHRVLVAPPHLLAEAQPPLRATWNALNGNGGNIDSNGDSKGDGSGGSTDADSNTRGGIVGGRLTSTPASGQLLKPVAARKAKPSGVRFASTEDDVIPLTTIQDDKNATFPDDECFTPPRENAAFGTDEAVNDLSSELAQLRSQVAASLDAKPSKVPDEVQQESVAPSNSVDIEQGNFSDSDGAPKSAPPKVIFGIMPLRDAAFERIALTSAAARLEVWLAQQPTLLAEDEALLAHLTSASGAASVDAALAVPSTEFSSCSGVGSVTESNGFSDDGAKADFPIRVDNDRALNALRYRLTRKRIVMKQLVSLELLKKELDLCCLANVEDESDVAAALKAVGLPPPPVPPLEKFPAGLWPHVAALRSAYSPKGKTLNEVKIESEKVGAGKSLSSTIEKSALDIDLGSRDEPPKIEMGCRVEVHSLLMKPTMNGKLGEVVAAAPDDGRWAVLVDGAAKPIALKPENLKALSLSVVH